MKRSSSLLLATSHVHLYKKLDEFGKDFKKDIETAVEQQSEFMDRQCNSANNINSVTCTADVGRKITIDNFDFHQDVHYMTEENQNIDTRYLSLMATENRVCSSELSDVPVQRSIKDMDNGKCILSRTDHQQQRNNYLILVERILIKYIRCMNFLAHVVTQHIPHKCSKEMSQKSNTVRLP